MSMPGQRAEPPAAATLLTVFTAEPSSTKHAPVQFGSGESLRRIRHGALPGSVTPLRVSLVSDAAVHFKAADDIVGAPNQSRASRPRSLS
jgi:hypothetical protein